MAPFVKAPRCSAQAGYVTICRNRVFDPWQRDDALFAWTARFREYVENPLPRPVGLLGRRISFCTIKRPPTEAD